MDIKLEIVSLAQKPILRNLMEYYEYDFSAYTGRDVNSSGTFEYKYLDYYWTEDGRYPYFIMIDDVYVGFALVRKMSKNEEFYYSMAEFFILKKYRRKNIGKQVANIIFSKHKGSWEIYQQEKNIAAQKFWRSTIDKYTNGDYKEIVKKENGENNPCQIFTSK